MNECLPGKQFTTVEVVLLISSPGLVKILSLWYISGLLFSRGDLRWSSCASALFLSISGRVVGLMDDGKVESRISSSGHGPNETVCVVLAANTLVWSLHRFSPADLPPVWSA